MQHHMLDISTLFVKLQQISVPSSGPSGSDLLSLPSHNPRVLEVHYTRSGASE